MNTKQAIYFNGKNYFISNYDENYNEDELVLITTSYSKELLQFEVEELNKQLD